MANQPYSTPAVPGTNAVYTDQTLARKDALTRYFKFEVVGSLIVGNKQGGSFNFPFNGTLVQTSVRTTSGSAVVRLNRDATVMDSGINATSSPATTTPGGSPNFTKDQLCTMDITGVTSGVDLVVTLEVLITT